MESVTIQSSLRAFFLPFRLHLLSGARRKGFVRIYLPRQSFSFSAQGQLNQMLTAVGELCGAVCRTVQSILSASVCLRLAFASC